MSASKTNGRDTFLKKWRERIEKDWGKKCNDFYIDCCVCQVHLALEILEQRYAFASEADRLKKEN